MNLCKYIILFLSTVFIMQGLAKDNKVIKGKVVNQSGNPLPAVNVYIIETYEGTSTDIHGEFSFTTSSREQVTLIASMVGYSKYSAKIDLSDDKDIFDLQIKMQEEAVELEGAVVMGSLFSSESSKGLVVSSIDVMTTPGGAADLYQSLKTMPGLTQVSENAELYVRGGDPTETVTMIDQASIYHPYTLESAYGGLFSNLNTGAVSEMYFSSGGFSAKYGNVLSGVLDIQTKDLPTQTGFSAGLSMAAVSLDGQIPLINDKLGLRFYSQQSYTKPIMWLNDELNEFTATPTSRNLTASAVYKFSKTGKIKLLGIIADDREGVNIQRAEFDGVFNGNTKTNFLNLQVTDLLGINTLIKSSISYNSHDNNWQLGALDLNTVDRAYKLRTDIEHTFTKEIQLLTGAEFENRKITYIGTIPKKDYDYRPDAEIKILDERFEENRIGGYAEIKKLNLFGIENLFAIAGIRTDHFSRLNITNFDPRFGFGYQISANSKIRFAYGIFHQLPDFRYYAEEDGNPDLKSMQASHFVLSYDYEIDNNNSFRVELYHKGYNNLPLEDDLINYNNNGHGYANGADIIFKGELPFNVTGWISYGFIDTKRQWLDDEKLTNSSFDITHNLSVILKYNFSPMWQIGLNFKYATGRPYTPVESSIYYPAQDIYEPVYGANNSARYPDYKRLDVRLTHMNLLFGKLFAIFYVEALNILDINNLHGYTYNRDYTKQHEIKSYFGRRTIVVGTVVSF